MLKLTNIDQVEELLILNGKSCLCPHCLVDCYVVGEVWVCYYCREVYVPKV